MTNPLANSTPSSQPLDAAAAGLEAARRLPEIAAGHAGDPVGVRVLSKLKWRCRRGLLENDLFIARFFDRHESRLTLGQAQALETLMDLADNDLLDLLLGRKEPEAELASAPVVELLGLMRVSNAANSFSSSRTSI